MWNTKAHYASPSATHPICAIPLPGRLLRDIGRKLSGASNEQQVALRIWLERASRICRQHPKDRNKLYALHAPEVECISKGKARQPDEFGVKVSLDAGLPVNRLRAVLHPRPQAVKQSS
jgi:hypothetical protein